jgi:hypothetical protein
MAVLLVAGIAAIAFWPEKKEPEYKGRKLSEWLALYYEHPDQASEGVKAIGSNGIPFLIKWIEGDHRQRNERRREYLERWLPSWMANSSIATKWTGTSQSEQESFFQAGRGNLGFQILGTNAASAIPRLTRDLGGSVLTANWAVHSMAYLGPDALPPLLQALQDDRKPIKQCLAASAICHMAYLGSNAIPAIPILVRCLSRTNGAALTISGEMPMFQLARQALENFATDPISSPALAYGERKPQITAVAPAEDPVLRRAVVQALADFGKGPYGEWAIMVVRTARDDSDADVRSLAKKVFQRIVSDVETVPGFHHVERDSSLRPSPP